MIPDRLLPLSVVLVRPAVTTDRYNNPSYDYGPAAARTTIRAWIEQADLAREQIRDGRDAIESGWKLITNHTGVDPLDRVEWDGQTFDVDGEPWPVYTPAGLHHIEGSLRKVQG